MSTTTSNSCCSNSVTVPVSSAVGPSILNCDFVNIKAEVAALVAAGVDFVHLDVMDGNFVDDITFGPSFVRSLVAAFPDTQFEVHMMVTRPMQLIGPMAAAGVHRYIFHYEVTKEGAETAEPRFSGGEFSVKQLVDSIRTARMEPSLALNPATPVTAILPLLHLVPAVLVMTVVPGLGGQAFMAEMMAKVTVIRSRHPSIDIELDGGVSRKVIELCGQSGANRVVVGTALIRSTTKSEDVVEMRKALFPVDN